MASLIKYDAACRALSEARAVDEVRDIRDKAEAMRVYGRQAKNRTLEIDAAEIRMRAERRLGELIIAQKETIGLNRGAAAGGRKDGSRGSFTEQRDERPTLEQVGVDRKLSSRAQKMAAVPEAQFERLVGDWRAAVQAENERVSVDLLRHGEEEQKRQARRDLARELSDVSARLTGQRKYACIYADPAWRRKAGVTDRSYENHYPTMEWSGILALPVRDLILPDAWLFLWLPRAHLMALHPTSTEVVTDCGEVIEGTVRLPLAWAIAKAWGFDSYSTCFVWTKTDDDHPDDIGTGLVVRDQDEILCLFKRGRGLPKPASGEKFGSNHRERSKPLGHSRKPEFYRRMIATMTGGVPVLELFARVDDQNPLPAGWDAWGNQADGTSNLSSDGGPKKSHLGTLTGGDAETESSGQRRAAGLHAAGVATGPSDESQAKAVADIAATEGASAPAAEGVNGAASRLAGGRTPDSAAGSATDDPAAPDPLDIPAFLKRGPNNSWPAPTMESA